jgi:hypothetical protein
MINLPKGKTITETPSTDHALMDAKTSSAKLKKNDGKKSADLSRSPSKSDVNRSRSSSVHELHDEKEPGPFTLMEKIVLDLATPWSKNAFKVNDVLYGKDLMLCTVLESAIWVSCINTLNCCVYYLCLKGWVYVFYINHIDKIMKPFSIL